MTKLYVLLKRKGSKRPFGAIPTKKGTSIAKLRKIIPKQIKSGFSAKIVTDMQLKRIIGKMKPRKVKRTRRRKTRRRR